MNQRQQRRAAILTRLQAHQLSKQEAAQLLGLTLRQINRLLARFQTEGLSSVIHANTGRSPAHKTTAETLETIRTLAGKGGRYEDFNASHLCDLLREQHNILIGRSTLDRLLKQERLRRPKRSQPRRVFQRRERASAQGQMLQIDASPHDWLEGRGPKMCLLGSIDDATRPIVYAHFHPTEDQAGYLLMLREIATVWGLPESLYHDKHTILCSPKEATLEDELAGKQPQSQFQQVLALLGIQAITAHSPQAKGRIERLWQTLQDRLRKEMRLAGVCTREEANAFLPGFIKRFNARFAKEAAQQQSAWVALEEGTDLAFYFATRENRTVRADHTLAWYGQTLLLPRSGKQPSLAGQKVAVHTTPEGTLHVYLSKQPIQHRLMAARALKEEPAAKPTPAPLSKADVDPGAKARRNAWLYGRQPQDIFTEQL